MNPSIELDGLREALDALKKMGGTPADAKSMNKQVVDEVVVPGAKRNVPVRSGNLKASIDSDATATFGYILAGNRGEVEYAGVIHFGWSTRGLGSGLQGTLKERRTALQDALGRSSGTALSKTRKTSINKAARYAGKHGVKHAVRGGPISPQPFIYDAIDSRVTEVFAAYEDQLEHRAEIAGLL